MTTLIVISDQVLLKQLPVELSKNWPTAGQRMPAPTASEIRKRSNQKLILFFILEAPQLYVIFLNITL